MVGNHSVYAQIQKRRRRSTPTSPISPTATWQYMDPAEHTFIAPQDETTQSAATSSQSPAIDVDVPSPIFEIPFSLTPESAAKEVRGIGITNLPRFSEEYQQSPRATPEQIRPATSSANTPRLDITSERRRGLHSSPLEGSGFYNRPSSSNGGDSPFFESGGRHTDRVGHTNRTLSYSSWQMDSSPIDDSTKHVAPKKSRLNLLNPMSLLARRRSSQNQNKLEDAGLSVRTQGVPAIPDDYDPRIRGNIVHDFSAPRPPRRIHTSVDLPISQGQLSAERSNMSEFRRASDFSILLDSPSGKRLSQSPKHSPIFTEHFQDDGISLRPAQTGYLHSLAASEMMRGDANSVNVPAFAKKLPSTVPEKIMPRAESPNDIPPPPMRPAPEPEDSGKIPATVTKRESSSEEVSIGFEDAPAAAIGTKPPARSELRRLASVPKHMTSTSSRFSFLGNLDSAAQEKLLEDRHKQRAASEEPEGADIQGDAEEDDYGNYDFDEDDGLEERIPGVNADLSDEEFEPPSSPSPTFNPLPDNAPTKKRANLRIDPVGVAGHTRKESLHTFHFTPAPSGLSSGSTALTSQSTPRDENGQIIGLADTSYSPRRTVERDVQADNQQVVQATKSLAGLGLTSIDSSTLRGGDALGRPKRPSAEVFEDLYFDDGEFDDLIDDEQGSIFDEEVFDKGSENIPDLPAQNAKKLEESQQRTLMEDSSLVNRTSSQLPVSFDLEGSQAGIHDHARGLTEGNLAAYHAALVSAADVAAANGRFTRSISNSGYSDERVSQSQIEDSPPGLSSDEPVYNHLMDISGIEDDDGFPFDDNGEDDDMIADAIAEANAEVLENDDDGFYGQEFGFYARARGKNSSELEYGGYFSSRGSSGVKRSHSAKANFQEPSLTPITERSEWSTRNSVASLHIPGMPGSAQSIPSPGIAQLRDFDDEDMSFSALMKLRRGAFGGSSTSINSLGGSHSGSSPLAHVSGHSFGIPEPSHRITSSIHSLTGSLGIPESEAEDELIFEHPTYVRNTPSKRPSDPEPSTPDSAAVFTPLSGNSHKGKISHSRNSSGASETVSYVRDPDGRWLLERRRTAEDGEEEVVGREYLAAGRI